MSSKPKLHFRADGNSTMGLGHVFRSLALAEMLSDKFECHFIIRNPLETLREQILKTCDSIIELSESNSYQEEVESIILSNVNIKIIILDGYQFDTAYQQKFVDKRIKTVYIDDIQPFHFVTNTVINHSGGLTLENFSKENYTKIYHGLKYALLRKPFRDAAKKRIYSTNNNQNVFICFGGADPQNDTLAAIKKCETATFIDKCYIILGAAYKYKIELEKYIKTSKLNLQILSNLSAQEMVNYMRKCTYAIMPPSSVSFEYMSVGGILFLKVIADNQAKMYDYFIKEGLAFSFNDFREIVDKTDILERQAQRFDGQQKERFLQIFNNL